MEEQAILDNIVFVTLYGGVIMLCILAALYLLMRRGNAIAPNVASPVRLRRWAAAFMIADAFSHIFWMFYAMHPSPAAYDIVCGLDVLMLFPTIAGILLSMMQDRHRPVGPLCVLLIPVVVLIALSIIREDDVLLVPLSIYVFALYALLTLHVVSAVLHYGRWLRDNYADLENKEIWQSILILAVFLLFLVMYSSTSIESSTLVHLLLELDSIFIVALLLWRVETLQQLCESTQPEAEPEEKVHKTSVPPAIPANIGPLLKKECEDGQLYLQHDLTLVQLAKRS